MPSLIRTAIRCVGFPLLLAAMPSWAAQSDAGEAPVPAQITAAKKVFVSNSGGGCTPFGKVGFTKGADRPYNQFYAAMKSWGRYELSPSPAEADLAFEISFSCPAGVVSVIKGDSVGPSVDPQLRVAILDIRTHIVLWGITEHVEPAMLQSNRDKNFDEAMGRIVADLKNLTSRPAAPPDSGGAKP